MTPAELARLSVAWSDRPREDEGDPAMLAASSAVQSFVASLPVVTDRQGAWTPDVQLGAAMLTARLHRRRSTPNGVEAFGDGMGATYVSRFDPDVAMLLRLSAPQVG